MNAQLLFGSYLIGLDFNSFSFQESVLEPLYFLVALCTVSVNHLYTEANSTTAEEIKEKLSISAIDSVTLQRKSGTFVSSRRWKKLVCNGPHL